MKRIIASIGALLASTFAELAMSGQVREELLHKKEGLGSGTKKKAATTTKVANGGGSGGKQRASRRVKQTPVLTSTMSAAPRSLPILLMPKVTVDRAAIRDKAVQAAHLKFDDADAWSKGVTTGSFKDFDEKARDIERRRGQIDNAPIMSRQRYDRPVLTIDWMSPAVESLFAGDAKPQRDRPTSDQKRRQAERNGGPQFLPFKPASSMHVN